MLELLQILHRQRVWITFGIALVVVLAGLFWVVSPRKSRVMTILEIPAIVWEGKVVLIVKTKNLADIRAVIRERYAAEARPSSDKLPSARAVIARYDPKARRVLSIAVVVQQGNEGLAQQWLAGIYRRIVREWKELLRVQENAFEQLEHDYEEANTQMLRLIDAMVGDAGERRRQTSEAMGSGSAVQQLIRVAEERRKQVFLAALAKATLADVEGQVDELAFVTEDAGKGTVIAGFGLFVGVVVIFFSALYRDFWIRYRAAILMSNGAP